eukprot:CAMPEP_0174293570 /NCGR_PEP_ID=MMETSP0809-20121228/38986_1 /TAXON_ID=73025 ORGANISM="Eutreptiella gymnastica-like, Strain CCMP1594" /NCGR_SAMPLE_ID=MMETSP0809 /ASSEMBLY_ACC=CAM_ASM_000658 /LENGTH=49 /DNA_ID=CAMNT_0015394435 /DNA_START=251 /DNA_END=400 /DNA_ORIENTATION=+
MAAFAHSARDALRGYMGGSHRLSLWNARQNWKPASEGGCWGFVKVSEGY